MLTVTKEQNGNTLTVRLTGSIEESVNFEDTIGAIPAELPVVLIVNCKEIARINSVGVKWWIKYFQALAAKRIKFKFVECSTAIVEQFNLISNFACGGPVESIFVPYSCTKCKTELIGLFATDVLKKNSYTIPDTDCKKCGGKAIFDDIPEEYLGFLTR